MGPARRAATSSASRRRSGTISPSPPDERGSPACSCARSSQHGSASSTRELAEVTTNWRLERLGVVERCVLRLAAAELQRGETPPRVVIQEAVTLAERYGSAAEREVRQRRARRARATHGADVVRILLVNWQDRENPQAGGAEIHLHEIFGRLAAHGHEVTLLCGGWPGCPPRATLDGIEVHRVGHAPHVSVPRAPLLSTRTSRGWARRARRGHQQGSAVHAALGRDRRRWRSCRICSAATAFQELAAPLAAAVWLAERPLGRVYRGVPFQAISESTADDLAERGIPRASVEVIYPGIDTVGYTPNAAERVADAGVRLPRPAEEVQGRAPRHPRLRGDGASRRRVLEIAGAGDYRPALEALARSLDLGERVRFLGRISEAEKLALLRRAWALVFASPKEGWGITNLEAAACAHAGRRVELAGHPRVRARRRDGLSRAARRRRARWPRRCAASRRRARSSRTLGRAGARVSPRRSPGSAPRTRPNAHLARDRHRADRDERPCH